MHESRLWEITEKQQRDLYYNFNNLAEIYMNLKKYITY